MTQRNFTPEEDLKLFLNRLQKSEVISLTEEEIREMYEWLIELTDGLKEYERLLITEDGVEVVGSTEEWLQTLN